MLIYITSGIFIPECDSVGNSHCPSRAFDGPLDDFSRDYGRSLICDFIRLYGVPKFIYSSPFRHSRDMAKELLDELKNWADVSDCSLIVDRDLGARYKTCITEYDKCGRRKTKITQCIEDCTKRQMPHRDECRDTFCKRVFDTHQRFASQFLDCFAICITHPDFMCQLITCGGKFCSDISRSDYIILRKCEDVEDDPSGCCSDKKQYNNICVMCISAGRPRCTCFSKKKRRKTGGVKCVFCPVRVDDHVMLTDDCKSTKHEDCDCCDESLCEAIGQISWMN